MARMTNETIASAYTLAAFARALDEHVGTPTHFAETVRELAQIRAEIDCRQKRRDAIYEQVTRRYRSGTVLTSDRQWELRASTPAPVTTVRTIEADTVKRKYPQAWKAARCPVKWVSVRPPKPITARVTGLPAVPSGADPLDAVVAAYKHRAFACLPELATCERDAIAELSRIADAHGWDGLPILMHDDWFVSLRTMRFSADVLAEQSPEIFAELAIDKQRGGHSHVVVSRLSSDDTADESSDEYAP